jgi:hypothetical protein
VSSCSRSSKPRLTRCASVCNRAQGLIPITYGTRSAPSSSGCFPTTDSVTSPLTGQPNLPNCPRAVNSGRSSHRRRPPPRPGRPHPLTAQEQRFARLAAADRSKQHHRCSTIPVEKDHRIPPRASLRQARHQLPPPTDDRSTRYLSWPPFLPLVASLRFFVGGSCEARDCRGWVRQW